MPRWPTVLGIVLGLLLIVLGGAVSYFAASQAYYISHAEQGLCGDPQVCAELETEYRYWSTVLSLSVLGILGGLVMFIWAVIRGIANAARSRPRPPEPVCVSCGWPLVWVLPSGRWYCRTCAQYR